MSLENQRVSPNSLDMFQASTIRYQEKDIPYDSVTLNEYFYGIKDTLTKLIITDAMVDDGCVGFYEKIKLPPNLEILHLSLTREENLKTQLPVGFLPPNLKELVLNVSILNLGSSFFSGYLKKQQVEKEKLKECLLFEDGAIPSSVLQLSIHYSNTGCKLMLGKIPQTVTELTIEAGPSDFNLKPEMLPSKLRNLALSCSFDPKILQPDSRIEFLVLRFMDQCGSLPTIPHTVSHLELPSDLLEIGCIPPSVKNLIIYSNGSLADKIGCIPSTVEHISLIGGPLDVLPPGFIPHGVKSLVTNINIDPEATVNQPDSPIPLSVTSISIKHKLWSSFTKLPSSLTHLECYYTKNNVPPGYRLPESITKLKLDVDREDFNLDKILPSNLVNLEIKDNATILHEIGNKLQHYSKYPALSKLRIDRYNLPTTNSLRFPRTLKHLNLSIHYTIPLLPGDLPDGLETLTKVFCNNPNQHNIDSFPSSLRLAKYTTISTDFAISKNDLILEHIAHLLIQNTGGCTIQLFNRFNFRSFPGFCDGYIYYNSTTEILKDEYNGDIPIDYSKLLKLPGIGKVLSELILQGIGVSQEEINIMKQSIVKRPQRNFTQNAAQRYDPSFQKTIYLKPKY
eukprot:gene6012-7490_t